MLSSCGLRAFFINRFVKKFLFGLLEAKFKNMESIIFFSFKNIYFELWKIFFPV